MNIIPPAATHVDSYPCPSPLISIYTQLIDVIMLRSSTSRCGLPTSATFVFIAVERGNYHNDKDTQPPPPPFSWRCHGRPQMEHAIVPRRFPRTPNGLSSVRNGNKSTRRGTLGRDLAGGLHLASGASTCARAPSRPPGGDQTEGTLKQRRMSALSSSPPELHLIS